MVRIRCFKLTILDKISHLDKFKRVTISLFRLRHRKPTTEPLEIWEIRSRKAAIQISLSRQLVRNQWRQAHKTKIRTMATTCRCNRTECSPIWSQSKSLEMALSVTCSKQNVETQIKGLRWSELRKLATSFLASTRSSPFWSMLQMWSSCSISFTLQISARGSSKIQLWSIVTAHSSWFWRKQSTRNKKFPWSKSSTLWANFSLACKVYTMLVSVTEIWSQRTFCSSGKPQV